MATMAAKPGALAGDIHCTVMTRRAFAAGAAAAYLLAACKQTNSETERRGSNPSAEKPAPENASFYKLSRALTGHQDLDRITSNRTAAAFGKLYPSLAASFGPLSFLSRQFTDPAALLAAASANGHGEAALAIVAAWYTGTVGKGPPAIALAYAEALMNRPVADALYPPTYQLGGPAWWTAEPPPVDRGDAPLHNATKALAETTNR